MKTAIVGCGQIADAHLHHNGVDGSYNQHNSYLQSVGVLYEFNRYGPLRPKAEGSALKDRSVGAVIRYSRLDGAARSLDLVEAARRVASFAWASTGSIWGGCRMILRTRCPGPSWVARRCSPETRRRSIARPSCPYLAPPSSIGASQGPPKPGGIQCSSSSDRTSAHDHAYSRGKPRIWEHSRLASSPHLGGLAGKSAGIVVPPCPTRVRP
jgi:hypothetical protein